MIVKLNSYRWLTSYAFPQIIKSKKEEFFARPEKDQDKVADENENFKTPQIFIEQLFRLYKKGLVDDKMIKDQVNLLIFGVCFFFYSFLSEFMIFLSLILKGNDTSALATSHAILLLAMHPDIQEKAVKELEEVYENEDSETDYEKLSKLPYLEMVVKEASKSKHLFLFTCTLSEPKIVIISLQEWNVSRHQ